MLVMEWNLLPSATKLRRLCFYRRLSVHVEGGVCLSACWDTTPPWEQTPPPRSRHCWGWYASYRNAFLFHLPPLFNWNRFRCVIPSFTSHRYWKGRPMNKLDRDSTFVLFTNVAFKPMNYYRSILSLTNVEPTFLDIVLISSIFPTNENKVLICSFVTTGATLVICITLVSDILRVLITLKYSFLKHCFDAFPFSTRRLVPVSFSLGKLVIANRVNRKASEICRFEKFDIVVYSTILQAAELSVSGRNGLQRGANIWFCQIFKKNCMKLRKFWGEGERPPMILVTHSWLDAPSQVLLLVWNYWYLAVNAFNCNGIFWLDNNQALNCWTTKIKHGYLATNMAA